MSKINQILEFVGTDTFTGCNFAPYVDSQGNQRDWLGPDKRPTANGPIVKQRITRITEDKPRAKEFLDYVKDHPLVVKKQMFRVRDLNAEENARMKKDQSKSDVLNSIYNMTEERLRETLMLCNADYSGRLTEMQTRLMLMAETEDGMKKIHQATVIADREYLVALYRLQEGTSPKIVFTGGRYRLGSENGEVIGFTESGVVEWMQTHKDEYAYLLKSMEQATVTASASESVEGTKITEGHTRKASDEYTKPEREPKGSSAAADGRERVSKLARALRDEDPEMSWNDAMKKASEQIKNLQTA